MTRSGASTVPPSHGWSGESSKVGVVPVANPVPAGFNCSDHSLDEPGPPDFQTRYGVPLASVKAEGSMEPPSACWHSRGAVEASTNGPCGTLAVATEMH